jgi:hypothetical protein
MPETREKVRPWAVETTVNTPQDPALWRRFGAEQMGKDGSIIEVPSGLVLDGRNRYFYDEEHPPTGLPGFFTKNENDKFAPHGYAILAFNGPDLVESVLTPAGVVIHEMKVG